LRAELRRLSGSPALYLVIPEMNPNFVFNQIRRYNKATSQLYKDAALVAAGVHVGLLQKRVPARQLTNEERKKMLYFLDIFCQSQGITVTFK